MDKSPSIPGNSSEASRSQSDVDAGDAVQLYPTLSRESTSSIATITPKTDSWPSKSSSQNPAPSVPTSAAPSREPSPTRPLSRTTNSRGSSATPGNRSRKNSTNETSPSRLTRPNNTTTSSSSKTLSSSNTPTLLPAKSDSQINAPVPVKSPTALEHIKESPRWPVSPRLRSPPPILNRPNLGPPRRLEQDTPLINIQRATPPQPFYQDNQSDTDTEEGRLQSGARTPARAVGASSTSILETVQEASPLSSPRGLESSMEEKLGDSFISETSQTSQADSIDAPVPKGPVFKAAYLNDSGSESGSIKASRRTAGSSNAPPPLTTRQSSTSVRHLVGKGKAGEASLQSMTVETETVTSIPQVALAPNAGIQGSNGSLRTKPSNETIRPRKEKKKGPRKQPSVTTGTASSKADIFEAKVASAVEEANSSDSEETFVYDSNPPDARDRPQRFHSRTPSATSMASQVDRTGMRSIHTVMENAAPPITVKKSMKFVNTYNSNTNDGPVGAEDDGRGTGRSNVGSTRGTARHHHHFGRWGRNGGGNGHPSLFAEQSPFGVSGAPANYGSRQSSAPPSPRYASRGAVANGKRGTHLAAGYDLDDTTTGADDERTPLIQTSTIRSSRSGRLRGRGFNSARAVEAQSYRSPPSVLNRFASCLVLTVMLLLVVSGAIGFMFATSQPLDNIALVSMDQVVASQQELMLDLTVKAHNPNVVVVVIDSADIEVFAKSPHAGTDSDWRQHTQPGEIEPVHGSETRGGGQLSLNEASPGDELAPNMRLGTITKFDSPLSFEGYFFHSGVSFSTGEVRLKNPGNGTVAGPERWEQILKDEFTLILKGVLKYTLPLSQRVRTAKINGEVVVKANAANDPVISPPTTGHEGVSIS
ncbi:vacuolar segregation protein 7 [Naviculisporaceae sp. PSN 640]